MGVEVLNISICDDISSERLILKQMIDRYMKNGNIVYNVDEYNSGKEMLEGEYSKYSLIFLDIFMDDLDGIETAKLIKSENKSANIVFCSTSNEFAAESYNVSAFYYITKPVNENILFSVLDNFFQMYFKMRSVTVKVGRDTQNILIADIIYAESQGKKTLIHTKSKIIEASIHLSQLEAELPQNSFCKPIRYALVSMDEIVQLPSDCLILTDGSCIRISRSLRKEIKDRFTQYKLENIRRRFLK